MFLRATDSEIMYRKNGYKTTSLLTNLCYRLLLIPCFCIVVSTLVLLPASVRAQEPAADSFAIKTQNWQTDSLERIVNTVKEDTVKVLLLNELSWRFAFNQPEKGFHYFKQALALSQKLNYKRGIADAYQNAAWCQWTAGNYSYSLQLALKSLHLFEELNNGERIAWCYLTLANIYRDFGDYPKALQAAHNSIQLYDALHISARVPLAVAGSIYEMQDRLDSALIYIQKAHALDLQHNQGKWGWIKIVMGNIYRQMEDPEKALAYYRAALPVTVAVNMNKDLVDIYNGIAIVHRQTGNVDSAILYAREVLQKWSAISYQKGVLDATNIMAQAYKWKNEKDSTIKYLEQSVALNHKLYNQEIQRDIQNLSFEERTRQEEIERERQRFRNQLKLYGLLGFGLTVLAVAILLWRNNRHKQKANIRLQQQKEQTEKALQELKAAQAQLVQSEKMASLGELTAGIAHEIQNPLNFINNFAEVNTELITELEQEAATGNWTDVKMIAADLKSNEQKIAFHGKRADGIVKNMLQHSRASKGEKQPTDMNVLVDEYLRLSYHGLRAKDKLFNATIKTNLEAGLGNVNIVPQEVGRVLLNLFNNAFYAVHEQMKKLGDGYEPTVSVHTKKLDGKIEISVRDNGLGISKSVVDKVFQPFFTTKPTGQGTGLGLSLSYDIIKAHGGELKIETEEGKGATFTIQIPAQ
jgi:signal transduction histidine kinase